MLYKCYLKRGNVYVPTVVRLQSPVYMDVEPVAVVPVTDTAGLRKAFFDTIARKNDSVTPSIEQIRGRPAVLKYSRDRSWSAFQRGAADWHIDEKNGNYRIVPHRTHAKGYWEEDPDQTIRFPSGTKIDRVIDRVIAILQDAAAQHPPDGEKASSKRAPKK